MTLSGLSEEVETLERREQGCNPNPRLTQPLATKGRAMNATQDRGHPETLGDIFAAWMSTADGCDCGNLQPPDACIPSTTPGCEYRCHYRCGDCGRTWTRAYPKGVAVRANRSGSCDNESGPGGVGSTDRSLTHSSDLTREGLAS